MEGEMNQDADLLNDLLEQAPLSQEGPPVTAKLLSYWTGYSVKTISDYRTGKLNIPTRFWRAVLKHHTDERIPNLVLGDRVCDLVFTDTFADIENDRVALNKALEIGAHFHELMKEYAEILRDGRIDEADAAGMARLNRAYFAGRVAVATIIRSLNRAFKRNCQKVPS